MPTSEVELLKEHWIPMKPLTYEPQEVVSITLPHFEKQVQQKSEYIAEEATMVTNSKLPTM